MATKRPDLATLLPDWQSVVSHIVVDKEYETSKANQDRENKNLDAVLDMLVCDRAEKDYEWQSDVFIPDYPSIHWAQIGELVVQYFSRYDKVECPPSTPDPTDVLKAKAAKAFLNYHLNARYMHYLQKFIRYNSLNRAAGWAVLKLWYESDIEIEQVQVGVQEIPTGTGVDIYGDPIEQSEYPERMTIRQEPVYQNVKRINTDRPNFDVWPNHDVFMDNKYTYSLQDKDFVIFRSEVKLSELYDMQDTCQYFNLELLLDEDMTDTEQDTYNRNDRSSPNYTRVLERFDPDVEILERWNNWPVLVGQDEQGVPTVQNGIDANGDMLEGAILLPMIITVANIKRGKVLIRFQPNLPEFGGYGFLPACRIQCYIHPTKDRGIGDGIYSKELQIAINDNFNMTNDRTQIATYPTLKKRKDALVDNDTILFGPEHVMELEQMDDVDIFQIPDAPPGAYEQQAMLWQKLQQINATYSIDLGGFPARKEPVTTTMIAEQKSNIRNKLVDLTVEHTGLAEFYDMMLKMSGMFMQPETLMNILGDLAPWFDPEPEYNFVPVSTAILSEHAKESKIAMWDQILGRLINVPNPRVFSLINMIMAEIMELYGKEYAHYGKFLLDENAPHPQILQIMMQGYLAQQQAQARGAEGSNGQGGRNPATQQRQRSGNAPAPQNQYGNPQSYLERMGRQMGTQGGGGQM